MKPLVIFGAGQIAEVAWYYFTRDANADVKAFTVDPDYVGQGRFQGLPLVPFPELGNTFPPSQYDCFVALSYTDLNRLRAERYAQAKAKGYALRSYVSSRATIWPDFKIGENCFILEDNTIQPFVQLGNNVTLWSGNHVGHHAAVGDNCFISSHAVISGGVMIEENCFVGVNATIRDHVRIGRFSVLAAGAIIAKDVPEFAVMVQPTAEKSKVPSNRLRTI